MTKAKDFYDIAEFHEIEHNSKGLDKLISLGDLFIIEPTGNYSVVWQDNLPENNREFRMVSNHRIIACRELCGWSAKDDQHDAVALAYYGWVNLHNFSAFNRVRDPRLETVYKLIEVREHINSERTPSVNRLRNLLSYEIPEHAKKRTKDAESLNSLFTFVAGRYDLMNERTVNLYKGYLKHSIGRVKKDGKFSEEAVSIAKRVVDLEIQRSNQYEFYNELLTDPDFTWMSEVMDGLKMEDLLKCCIIAQIHPFSQFVDADGKELRINIKQRRSKKGNKFTKRVGYKKFHALLGKGLFERSSGKQKGWVVSGPDHVRKQLYLWGNRYIARRNGRSIGCFIAPEGTILRDLQNEYDQDTALYSKVLGDLSKLPKTELIEGLGQLRAITLHDDKKKSPLKSIIKIISPLIEDAIKLEKPSWNKSRAQTILKDWAISRAGDKAVEILFKKLLIAYRERLLDEKP